MPAEIEELEQRTVPLLEQALSTLKPQTVQTTIVGNQVVLEVLLSASDPVRTVSDTLTAVLPHQPLISINPGPQAQVFINTSVHQEEAIKELYDTISEVGYATDRLVVPETKIFRLPHDSPLSAAELPPAKEYSQASFLSTEVHEVQMSLWGSFDERPPTLGVNTKGGRKWWFSLTPWPGSTEPWPAALSSQIVDLTSASVHGELYRSDPSGIQMSIDELEGWLQPWATDWIIAHGTGPNQSNRLYADHVEFWAWGTAPSAPPTRWSSLPTGATVTSWWTGTCDFSPPKRDTWTLMVLSNNETLVNSIAAVTKGVSVGSVDGAPLVVRWGTDVNDPTDLGQRMVVTPTGEVPLKQVARIHAESLERVRYRYNGERAYRIVTTPKQLLLLRENSPTGCIFVFEKRHLSKRSDK